MIYNNYYYFPSTRENIKIKKDLSPSFQRKEVLYT